MIGECYTIEVRVPLHAPRIRFLDHIVFVRLPVLPVTPILKHTLRKLETKRWLVEVRLPKLDLDLELQPSVRVLDFLEAVDEVVPLAFEVRDDVLVRQCRTMRWRFAKREPIVVVQRVQFCQYFPS
jgi:hypothetical protein